jgi:hypothetical protein
MEFSFALIVDVIPAQGRTKEEANSVVWGNKTVAQFELENTSPKDWSDEQIINVTKGFFNWFFRDAILNRLFFLRHYSLENPKYQPSIWENKKLLEKNDLAVPIMERMICDESLRSGVIMVLFYLFLLIFQPT